MSEARYTRLPLDLPLDLQNEIEKLGKEKSINFNSAILFCLSRYIYQTQIMIKETLDSGLAIFMLNEEQGWIRKFDNIEDYEAYLDGDESRGEFAIIPETEE